MLTTIMNDMSAALSGAVTGHAAITMAIMAIAVIGNGLLADGIGQVFGRASQALLTMAALIFLVYGFLDPGRFTLAAWSGHLQESWTGGMSLTLLSLLGYYLVALVGVAAVFAIRSVVRR